MSDIDPAHILFPSDAPKPTQAPEWFKAEQAAATTRLMGGATADGKATDGEQPGNPAGDEGEDAAGKIFHTEKARDEGAIEGAVSGFLESYSLGAFSEGDKERGEALKAAKAALTDDFRTAGTDARDVEDAFAILREANDHIVPPSPEKIEADMAAGLATLQSELGPSYESDIAAARALIRDLEVVAPGTVASLEHNGAGNDLHLVRAAIKEARRRGYGARR